jgi:hypothetical protein
MRLSSATYLKVKQNFRHSAHGRDCCNQHGYCARNCRTSITLEHSHAYKLPKLNLFRRYPFGYRNGTRISTDLSACTCDVKKMLS